MNRTRKKLSFHASRRAFTLVELLVVIAIIGLLSTVAVVATSSSRTKAKIAAGQSLDKSLATTQEMVGEWTFDSPAVGGKTSDTSGNGLDGTISNVDDATGYNGRGAYYFRGNGTGSNVLLGTDSRLNPSFFTISAWVKTNDVSGGYNYIYSNAMNCCAASDGINFTIIGNHLIGYIDNTTIYSVTCSTFIPNNSDWTFAAFSYDGSKTGLYLDGHLCAKDNYSGGVGQPASMTTFIGAFAPYGGGNANFSGTIDDVRLYSSSLTAREIQERYLAERPAHPLAAR